MENTQKVTEILEAKAQAGDDAVLVIFGGWDVILWADQASSVNDNGAQAVGRWDVTDSEALALLDAGAEQN